MAWGRLDALWQSDDPNPTMQNNRRKEEKEKTVQDKKGETAKSTRSFSQQVCSIVILSRVKKSLSVLHVSFSSEEMHNAVDKVIPENLVAVR